MHHTVGAAWIFAYAVALPEVLRHQVFYSGGVAIAQKITRLAPAHRRIGRVGPGRALVLAVAAQEVEIERVVVEAYVALRVQHVLEYRARLIARYEQVLVRHRLEMVSGRDHRALDSHLRNHLEHLYYVVLVNAVEYRRVGGNPVARVQRGADGAGGYPEHALAIDRSVVRILHPVQVDDEAEPLVGRDPLHHALHQQRVGAHIDEPLGRRDAVDYLVNLRMQRRLAAGYGYDRRARLLDGGQALLHAQHPVQNRLVLADAPAAYARQVALLQRLQHRNQRKALAAAQPVADYVPPHPQRQFHRPGHIIPL